MGDISEMRGLIVVFCVIAVSITLILLIPSEYYTASLSNAQVGDAAPTDVISWNNTYTINMTDPTTDLFQIGGYNVEVASVILIGIPPGVDPTAIRMDTYSNWWVFFWDWDYFRWIDPDGLDVSYTNHALGYPVIQISTLDNYANPVQFTAQNGKTKLTVSFSYNSTAYTSFQDAWTSSGYIYMVFNIDWDDRMTSISALSLIGMLFTASLPSVDPVINLLISFALWACTAYLVFIFALRIVGAVFGGGGA